MKGATFVALLLGLIAGGLLPVGVAGPVAIGVAVVGWAAARFIQLAPPARGTGHGNYAPLPINWNPLTALRRALGEAFANAELRIATMCISWFWALVAVHTSQFVSLAKNAMRSSEGVATLFLAAFLVGVAIGSAGVSRLLGGRISSRLSPWAGPVMALAGVHLYFAERSLHGAAGDVAAFLRHPSGAAIARGVDIPAVLLAAGLTVVLLIPLLRRLPQ